MKALRTSLVIAPALYVILLMAPDVAHSFYPKGSFGYIGSRYSGAVVTRVEPNSAAADAGIRVGDRIDTRAQTLHERLFVGTATTIITEMTHRGVGSVPYPGERTTVRVLHDGEWRTVTLVAHAHYPTSSDIFWNIYGLVERVIRLVLGCALLLVRPGRVTLAFYAYMLGVGTFGASDYYATLPAPLWIALLLPEYVIGGAVPATYALFWLLFPAGAVRGWRRPALYLVAIGFIVGIGIQLTNLFAPILSFDTSALDRVWLVYDLVGGSLGVGALAATALLSRGVERRLFGWLFVVVGGVFAVEFVVFLFALLHRSPPRAFDYISLLGLVVPLVIAYAIIRYQMFDVEYVLSRTIAYSMLAAVVGGVFVGADVAFAAYFHGSNVEMALDIALALAVGFSLKALHSRAVDLVDRLLFARRYDSRMRLKAAFDAIARAESQNAIEDILTIEAAAALGLASAVFFRRVADGGFLREVGFGWQYDSLWNLLADDKLTMLLEKRPNAVDVRSIQWSRTNECPPLAPALAVPMQFSDGVIGVTLYGDRVDGILLSRDDISGLVGLSQRAAISYAFFESKRWKIETRDLASARAVP